MAEFTKDDLYMLEKLCVSRIQSIERVFRDNVNCDPAYAALVGALAADYFRLLLKIHPGYEFISESPSFLSYLCA